MGIRKAVKRAIERQKAKRRMIKRGKRGLSWETVERVLEGIGKQEAARIQKLPEEKRRKELPKSLERIRWRHKQAKFRMVLKVALYRMGIMNTKKDPIKRQRIQKLAWEVMQRDFMLVQWGKGEKGMRDIMAVERMGELAKELGGTRKMHELSKTMGHVREEFDRKIKKGD